MPSTAKVYSARLSAAVCHSREAWELRLEQLEMEGIPKGITHVQLHWRRKASYSKKPEQVTGIAVVTCSDASESTTGTAGWTGVLRDQASIGISSGKPIPKYYEFIVKGTGQADEPFRTLGKLTVDVAQLCTDTPHGRPDLEFAMKPTGSLRVAVSASRVCDSAMVSRLHSSMSLGSDVSELTEDLADHHFSSLGPLHDNASPECVPERRCKSEATLEYSASTMSLDEEEEGDDDDLERSQKKRNASLNPDEVAYYLRVLGSDDSDDETFRKAAGPFGWLRVRLTTML